MLRVSWTEKSTNESISLLVEIGHARRDMSMRQRAAKQKLMFFGHMMRANGMEKDMMLAYGEGRRKKRPSDEEMDGGNTQDVRDESGGAEGCGGGSGLVDCGDNYTRRSQGLSESKVQGDKVK